MRSRLSAWAPAALWAAVLFIVSSQPTVPVDLSSGRDKIGHFLAYALLGALLARPLPSGIRIPGAIGLGFLYAAFDEVHQSYVPGRMAELADWLADALGVIAGAVGYHWWLRRRGAPSSAPPRHSIVS